MKTASSLHQTTAYMDMLPSLAIISEIAHQYICSPRTNAHTNSNTMATRRTNKNLGFNPLPIDHHFARCDRGRPQSIQYRSNRIAHPGNSCHIELHIYICSANRLGWKYENVYYGNISVYVYALVIETPPVGRSYCIQIFCQRLANA